MQMNVHYCFLLIISAERSGASPDGQQPLKDGGLVRRVDGEVIWGLHSKTDLQGNDSSVFMSHERQRQRQQSECLSSDYGRYATAPRDGR